MRFSIPKISNSKLTPLDYILITFFICFIVFQVSIPRPLASIINTPLGLIVIMGILLFLFFNTNPILGVLSLIVAYELLRRSNEVKMSVVNVNTERDINNIPIIEEKDKKTNTCKKNKIVLNTNQIENMNNHGGASVSMEQEIINKIAPIGISKPSVMIESTYAPVCEHTYNAGTF